MACENFWKNPENAFFRITSKISKLYKVDFYLHYNSTKLKHYSFLMPVCTVLYTGKSGSGVSACPTGPGDPLHLPSWGGELHNQTVYR